MSWSIGLYGGRDPFALEPLAGVGNPVLTSRDVSDLDAVFVADPFLVADGGGGWWMFFEALGRRDRKGVVALAHSLDGRRWAYRGVVLEETFHLSYPHVFSWRGEYYMTPESAQAGDLRLYRARRFPYRWELVATLLDVPVVDATPFEHGGHWWMLACTTPGLHEELALYRAPELGGPWQEHPQNPIYRDDRRRSRPAGRIFQTDGRLVRLAQDCRNIYGERVLAFEIEELSSERYREREAGENPILEPSASPRWNGRAMHHLDLHRTADGWIAAVDGEAPPPPEEEALRINQI